MNKIELTRLRRDLATREKSRSRTLAKLDTEMFQLDAELSKFSFGSTTGSILKTGPRK
jgi:hypothetical protein